MAMLVEHVLLTWAVSNPIYVVSNIYALKEQ